VRYLIFMAAFASSLLFTGCRKETVGRVRLDSELTAYIPPKTAVLAGVNLEKLESTALYKRHAGKLDIPALNAASERIGLDPRRDLSDVLVAWNPNQTVAISRGRFSARAMESKLMSVGAKREQYAGNTLFTNGDASLFFAKDNVLVAAPRERLRAIIDVHREHQTGIPDDLQGRLGSIPENAQLWVVSNQDLNFEKLATRSDVASALSNIAGLVTATNASVAVADGVQVRADLTCVSEEGAQRVRDALRGGIGLARLTTKDNELEMLRLYDAIHVAQEREAVHVTADLGSDLADKLLAYLPNLTGKAKQSLSR
jgi:hypothetical protein